MAAPVKMHEELELDIESLAFGGNGVARHDGFVVFVRRGLPGDRVRARVTKVKRGFAEALATDVVTRRARCASRRRASTTRPAAAAASRISPTRRRSSRSTRRCATRCSGSPASPSRRSSRSSRASPTSSSTATRWSTRSRRSDEGPVLGLHKAGRWDEVIDIREVLAHDRPRQRHPQRGARLGARGRARGVLAGGRQRLPPPPDRARGTQHGPGARAARHRAGREVREGLLRRGAAPLPRGALDPLGGQRPPRRGDEPAGRAPLGRAGDRGGARRPALPRAPERVHADEHVMAEQLYALAREAAGSPARRPSGISTAASARSACRSRRTRSPCGGSRSPRSRSRARSRTPS